MNAHRVGTFFLLSWPQTIFCLTLSFDKFHVTEDSTDRNNWCEAWAPIFTKDTHRIPYARFSWLFDYSVYVYLTSHSLSLSCGSLPSFHVLSRVKWNQHRYMHVYNQQVSHSVQIWSMMHGRREKNRRHSKQKQTEIVKWIYTITSKRQHK